MTELAPALAAALGRPVAHLDPVAGAALMLHAALFGPSWGARATEVMRRYV